MVFEIIYDPASNVKFVKCVEKYPAIYRHKNISRHNKDKARIAWEKIASELNSTAYYCRDRWTNLKGCYKRYLRLKAENIKRKPYYLAKHMEFVKPYIFTKSTYTRRRKTNVVVHSDPEAEDNITITDIQTTNDKTSMEECKDFSGNPICIVVDSSEDEEVVFSTGSSTLERSTSSKHYSSSKNSKETNSSEYENSDLCFYKSLLPEIDLMTPEQNLRFRKELLSAINMALYGEELNNVLFIKKEDEN